MPLSPRTLRPANTFTPRSISGLALWLDASATGDLYTTDAGPVVPVSSPTEIAGCALWLDGADSSAASMTLNGSLVETWKDKSGNARDFTATGAARPTLTSAAISTRSAVTFSGSSVFMTGNTAARDTIRNLAGYTAFFVHKVGSVAGGERLLCGFGATVIFRMGQTGSQPYAGGRRVGADSLENITGASGQFSAGSSYVTSVVVSHTAQSITGLVGGSQFATDATYMAAGSSENVASDATVGAQSSGYGFYNGDIAEVIFYNTALSTADRARVEAYLAQRWGITGVHAAATSASDPVGYWRDRSGNGRHAVQATGANRPTIHTATQNGRRVLSFDGSNDALLGAGAQALKDGMTVIGAYAAGSVNFASLFGVGDNVAGRRWLSGSSNGRIGTDFFTNSVTVTALSPNRTGINSFTFSPSANAIGIRVDGAQAALQSSLSPALSAFTSNTLAVGTTPAANEQWWTGRIFELAVYNRVLSASECRRVEQALAAKWGIVLAPQVSNADAQDWINRVYANGGTVTASTAAAVNQFCLDIENAPGGSIRDRFYRLNLFCGTGLNACLVPLYRGQSLGGTQFGNATDTNQGPFLPADYNEMGVSGGLTGNGSTKYLQTGLSPSAFITGGNVRSHLAVYKRTSTNSGVLLSARSTTLGNSWEFGAGGNLVGGGSGSFPVPSTHDSLIGVTRTTNTDIYAFRRTSLSSLVTASASVTGTSIPFAVFARNDQSTDTNAYSPNLFSNQTLAAYSIGLGLDATQLAAYDTAMQAFQTALQRNV